MYLSGNLTTFIPRLHQLPTGIYDLSQFEIEGLGYTGQTTFPKGQIQKIIKQTSYSVLGSGWLLAETFFTGHKYFSANQILSWFYNLTGFDNHITHGVDFANWSVMPDSTGGTSTKTSSGIIFIQSGTAEYFRYEATGLTPNTEYHLRLLVSSKTPSANGNVRLMGSGQDGANIWPVFPNNTVNYDFPANSTGAFFVKVKTDSSNTGTHRLTFRHATSPDLSYLVIGDVNLYPIPSRSDAKIAILGDRTAGYSAHNANLVARAILNASGDTTNIVAVGDLADGSTQYAVNNDVKTGIGTLVGVSGRGGWIYAVPGNWDYSNDGDLSNFNDYFNATGTGPGNTGFMNKKVTLGNVDFFLVDSNNIKSVASVAAAQALPEGQWLLGAISSGTSPWKIVVWHYPSHTSSMHHSQIKYDSQRWDWSGLGVQAVLSSHDHVYEKFRVSGAYYFTVGIGGGAINGFGGARQPFSEASGVSYGYLKLHDSPTELVIEYLNTGNQLLDRTKLIRYQA